MILNILYNHEMYISLCTSILNNKKILKPRSFEIDRPYFKRATLLLPRYNYSVGPTPKFKLKQNHNRQ